MEGDGQPDVALSFTLALDKEFIWWPISTLKCFRNANVFFTVPPYQKSVPVKTLLQQIIRNMLQNYRSIKQVGHIKREQWRGTQIV